MSPIRCATGHQPLPTLGDLRRDPRLAIREDSITCLICGREFRQLTNTHLHSHGTTAVGYKARFGYNRRRPLMALSLRQDYSARAVATGLAGRIRRRPILVEPELRRRGGARPIALEEYLTRREAQLRARAVRREETRLGAAPARIVAI
jgi:ROS/MUCR transcriptional regulator protein